jgi:hypothetical protein
MHLGRVLAVAGGMAIIAGGAALSPGVAAGGLVAGAVLAFGYHGAKYLVSTPKQILEEQTQIIKCRQDCKGYQDIEEMVRIHSTGGDIMKFTPKTAPRIFHTAKGKSGEKECIFFCQDGQAGVLKQTRNKNGRFYDPRMNDDQHDVRIGTAVLYPDDPHCEGPTDLPKGKGVKVDIDSFTLVCYKNHQKDAPPVNYIISDEAQEYLFDAAKE